MALNPLFGTLNGGVAKAILLNSPRYRRIVEPFGDGGTYALEMKKKRPREHILNIVDPALFAAMTFVQNPSGADKRRLKRMDWIGSREAFDNAMSITAVEGVDHFYKWFYTKKFGMSMAPGEPPVFDILSIGKDISYLLLGLLVMKRGLKSVTITNDEPMTTLSAAGGANTFLILLPKSQEDVAAVRNRLTGLNVNYFFAAKILDVGQALEWSKTFPEQTSVITAPSIMMAQMGVVTNYDNDLPKLSAEQMEM